MLCPTATGDNADHVFKPHSQVSAFFQTPPERRLLPGIEGFRARLPLRQPLRKALPAWKRGGKILAGAVACLLPAYARDLHQRCTRKLSQRTRGPGGGSRGDIFRPLAGKEAPENPLLRLRTLRKIRNRLTHAVTPVCGQRYGKRHGLHAGVQKRPRDPGMPHRLHIDRKGAVMQESYRPSHA